MNLLRNQAGCLIGLILVALSSGASAETFTGALSNNWNTAGNWNPPNVPNSSTIDALIPSPFNVAIDGSFTIRILDLDAGASASLPIPNLLTLHGNAAIDGVLNLGLTGSGGVARLRIATDLTLAGTGTVNLHRLGFVDSQTGARLTIGAGLTVRYHDAAGFDEAGFDLALTNNGTLLLEGGQTNFNHPDGQLINGGTGIVRAGPNARVDLNATNNPITIVNQGLWEADGGLFVTNFAEIANTGIVRLKNNGRLRTGFNFNNTGGTLEMETGGNFVPAASFTITFTGGAITGGVIDQTTPEASGTLILQGGPGNDAMDISATVMQGGAVGTVLAFAGDFDFANNVQILRSARIDGNVDIDGNGTMSLQLSGGTANDSLTLESGITLNTPANGGFSTVKVLNTAGPTEITGPDSTVGNNSTFTTSGPFHLAPNAKITTLDTSQIVLQSNTATLDSGAELIGNTTLQNATVNGPGKLRPAPLNLIGTNIVNAPIRVPANIVANAIAIMNGTGKIDNEGTSGTTNLNPAAPGATLTTGPDFDLDLTSGHTLVSNLPWNFQGEGTFNGGTLTLAADLENDGALAFTGSSQLNLNKNIVAGSTGSIALGPSTTVNVNGASTLGGTFTGNGNFIFSGTTVVTIANHTGTGAITLNNGAKVNFSNLVPGVTTLTVNSNNANVAFNGGLTSVGNATINGSSGIFAVTGNTIATGLLRVQGNSTHGGAGTTTAQGTVEYTGKLDGRTLIAQGPTTIFQLTLQNNAVFENQNTATLFNFGTPNTVTDTGIFRNTATLLQSDLFGPTPNTISATFEQTATGTTTASDVLTLSGNSTIAGNVNIPANGKLILSAGTTNTTHNLTGAVTGAGTLEVAENTVTGNGPGATLTGSINLSGANSTTIIRGASSLTVNTASAPGFGAEVLIDRGHFKIAGGAAPLPVSRVFLTEPGILDGPDAGPRIPFRTALLTAQGTDIDACSIRKTDLLVEQTCTTQGLVDLQNSTLEIDSGCTATFNDGTHFTSSTGGGELRCSGGTIEIPAFAVVELPAELPFQDHNGVITVRQHGELSVGGNILNSTSTIVVEPGATAIYSGPATLLGTTMTAQAGSGPNPGGTVSITNPQEIRNTTIVVEGNANAEVTAPVDENLRQQMRDFKLRMESPGGTLLQQAQLENIFFSGSQTGLGGNGCFTAEQLVPAGARIALEAGASPGQLQVYGNLPLGPGSDVYIELGGTTQITQYDLLSVTGVLTATNTSLRPRFINNFQNTITPANTFTVIETTQPIVGSFFNVFGGRVMAADRSGTFSVALTNGNTHVVLGDFIPGDVIDSDMDGMSDEFENEFFGSPTGGDPNADDDGDGMTNLEEYEAGTNPIDPNSVLRIDEIRREGNNIVIVFKTVADRAYRLEAGPNPTGDFPLTIANIPAAPSNGTQSITDLGAAANPPRFYRLVLLP